MLENNMATEYANYTLQLIPDLTINPQNVNLEIDFKIQIKSITSNLK
jgi:hypothetical protein